MSDTIKSIFSAGKKGFNRLKMKAAIDVVLSDKETMQSVDETIEMLEYLVSKPEVKERLEKVIKLCCSLPGSEDFIKKIADELKKK